MPEFGYLVLYSYVFKMIYYGLISVLWKNLDRADFKYLPCSVSPSTEQSTIARYLDETSSKINDVIARVQLETKLLSENRKCLIGDIVTGKLDVREGAIRLPQGAD